MQDGHQLLHAAHSRGQLWILVVVLQHLPPISEPLRQQQHEVVMAQHARLIRITGPVQNVFGWRVAGRRRRCHPVAVLPSALPRRPAQAAQPAEVRGARFRHFLVSDAAANKSKNAVRLGVCVISLRQGRSLEVQGRCMLAQPGVAAARRQARLH